MEFLFNIVEDSEIDDLYLASLEFRKEIALKGKGDSNKKNKAISIIQKYLKVYNLKDDIYSISIILQPFIISPAINVSDVAINWNMNDSVEDNIVKNHPFPILERMNIIDGKQYQIFIPTDDLKILPFGYGERKCTGNLLATIFLETFFQNLIQKNIWKPENNHKFSGRNNDNTDNLESIIFQFKTITRLFIS